jgi:hypothetical protein
MPSRKVQIRYWLVDAKQFTFWITLAFVAGAGPNLVEAIHPLLLLAVAIATGLVAGVLWLRNERKSGIGVYIHLPQVGDAPTSESLLKLVRKSMTKRHRDWFRSGPDFVTRPSQERVEWAIQTIQHRLHEADVLSDMSIPIFLYVHCRLEEAFRLGRTTAKLWEITAGDPTLFNSTDDSIQPKLSVDFRVRSISSYHSEGGVEYGLNLAHVKSPTNEPYDVDVDLVRNLQDKFGVPEIGVPRLALIVYAGPPENFNAFRDAALVAASGRASRGYLTTDSDRCDNAVVISVTSREFFSALREQDAERFVRQICQYWQEQAGKLYGRVDIPMRLFMNAPSILAFAIGVLAPPDSSLVSYDPALATAFEGKVNDSRTAIAIIDGDDVGNGMESRLLLDHLDDAVAYSRQIDTALSEIVDQLNRIPSMTLLSTGGDSAIFSFPVESLQAFIGTLDRLRKHLNFRISCGYGYSSHAAYMALRMAKASGKNRTEGLLDPSAASDRFSTDR